jgi:hypothetical protein
MVFSPRKTADPLVALKAIVDQNPRAGSAKWLALFEAQVYDDRSLHKNVITQAFAHSLGQLNGTGAPPKAD